MVGCPRSAPNACLSVPASKLLVQRVGRFQDVRCSIKLKNWLPVRSVMLGLQIIMVLFSGLSAYGERRETEKLCEPSFLIASSSSAIDVAKSRTRSPGGSCSGRGGLAYMGLVGELAGTRWGVSATAR
jgi:hypothetical protein